MVCSVYVYINTHTCMCIVTNQASPIATRGHPLLSTSFHGLHFPYTPYLAQVFPHISCTLTLSSREVLFCHGWHLWALIYCLFDLWCIILDCLTYCDSLPPAPTLALLRLDCPCGFCRRWLISACLTLIFSLLKGANFVFLWLSG